MSEERNPARPEPVTTRWQPLRSGLVNIFKYDDEEFRFEHGRLLLRGNNGAGKSRVLALQLPFLLDGELASHRVEPDGDPAKRIEWNLLMDRHENRLGYTWIEFGRRDDETGAAYFTTLGCALHARKGSGIPPNSRWFFVTEHRVGDGLQLVSKDGFPLNRERLAAVVGRENVYQTARDYRAAVDQRLFGLGERYRSLVDLLLQLRKPQIMRDFREDDLSRLLSEALPPLSPTLIENIGVSFRSLESDRNALEDFALAHASVEEFLRSYGRYVRVAVRRRADAMRLAHQRHDTVQREIKALENERSEAATKRDETSREKQSTANSLTAARQRERTLLDSPEMKNAETLRLADENATTLEKQRSEAEQEATTARHDADAATQARDERDAEVTARRENFETILRETNTAANAADLPELQPDARPAFERELERRGKAIARLEVRRSEVDSAKRESDQAEQALDARRGEVSRCEEAESDATRDQSAALEGLAAATYAWEAALTELRLDGGTDWRSEIENWLADPTPASPLTAAIRSGQLLSDAARLDEHQRLARDRDAHETLHHEATTERDSLLAGVQPSPTPSPTRPAERRATLPGAPLWKLCDFRPEVSPEDRAGYEAALESAGLLDAWVLPDGRVLEVESGDTFLTGDRDPDGGLNRVLAPDPAETSVAPKVVRTILAGIGADANSGPQWVSPDGRWRHGRLHGAWRKPRAQFLGHASREAARLQRLTELTAHLESIETELRRIESDEQTLAARRATLAAEVDAAPSPAELLKALHSLANARDASAGSRARLQEADDSLSKARAALDAATSQRDRDAADLGLTRWTTALDALRERTVEVRVAAANLWPAVERFAESRTSLAQANERSERAGERARAAADRSAARNQAAIQARSQVDTLRETVGSSADEVFARLAATRDEIARADQRHAELDDELSDLKIQLGVLEERTRQAEANRQERETARAHAAERLSTYARRRLIEEVAPDLQPGEPDLPATRAIELARALHQALADEPADDDTWQRLQSGIQEQFSALSNELVARGHHPSAEIIDDGVFVVTCAFQGQTRTMHDLDAALRGEIASREEMLTAQERAVIENHLIGEAATELQTRIRAGEDWVAGVNEEMAAHPTSSGIELRFRWEVHADASSELEAARGQLLKMTAAWSPAEREAMGRFLQGRIEAERRADEGASLHEHLVRALDYRAWHRFAVERQQDGTWKRLTKRTYGTGSGGEKALMLTMPQFAAASAHYRSAHPHAPRLILLDEVFVGIDAPTRAKLMGLLVNFDLDFVMTSEREWGCYPTLPALAICQLASRPGVDAVALTRWVWNGRSRDRN